MELFRGAQSWMSPWSRLMPAGYCLVAGVDSTATQAPSAEDGMVDSEDGLALLEQAKHTSYREEIRVLLLYSAPLCLSRIIMRYCTVLGPVSTAGKFGSIALAGASLGNTSLNIIWIAPTLGITSALDTLSTQAEGQEDKTMDLNMLYSLRVFLVLVTSMLLLLPIMLNIESLFILAQIDAESAASAARYTKFSCFGLPGWLGYETLRRYLQAKGKMLGPMAASIAAAPVAIPLMHSSIFGSDTPACALAIYFNISFLAEVAWAYLFLPKNTWEDIPSLKLICQDLGIVCKLGAAGVVASCSDWWSWEFLSFESAWLGSSDTLAAHGILLTTASFWSTIPGAVMNANATRFGNHLGNNSPGNAKTAAFASMGLGALASCLVAAVVALNTRAWTELYTDDPHISLIVQRILPLFCIIIVMDGIQGSYSGTLRGAGLTSEIARIMLSMHYLIGLPLATIFAFSALKWGLLGLWGGFGIGLLLVCVRLTLLITMNDWHEGARKAQAHIVASDLAVQGRTVTAP